MPPSPIRLTERDYDLLDALADYRFLSVAQAAVLHFPSDHAAARRLRELVAARLAVTVFLPVRPYSRKTEVIYGLAARGARLLAPRHDGIRPRHLTSREERSGHHLEHTLRRNDVRICLQELEHRTRGFTLLEWRQNPDRVRASVVVKVGTRSERRVPMVPDGVALVKIGDQCEVFAIEVDRATIATPKMWRRFRGYHTWWKRGSAMFRYGRVPYRVLTLVPDQKRLDSLAQAAARAPQEGRSGSKLFWFTTLDQADIHAPEKLLAPVWQVATVPTSRPCTLFRETP